MTVDLDNIQQRERAATPGPWGLTENGFIVADMHNENPESGFPVAEVDCYKGRKEDGEFIAHAREDIPALIEEVKRLRAGAAPGSWEWALSELRGGKSVTRPKWTPGFLTCASYWNGGIFYHYPDKPMLGFEPFLEDFDAQDWQLAPPGEGE